MVLVISIEHDSHCQRLSLKSYPRDLASEVLQPFDELEDMKSSVGSKTNFIHQRALIISFEIIPKGNFDLDFLESNPD